MITALVIKEDRTQLVLSPENEHDTEVLKVLKKLPNTHEIDFYDTEGGYTRFSNGGHRKDLAIIFDPKNLKDGFMPRELK